MQPSYDLDKIKFATDQSTYERAVGLYESGKVTRFVKEVVLMLREYAKLDPKYIKAFEKLCGQRTCFGWEEPLVKIFDEQ